MAETPMVTELRDPYLEAVGAAVESLNRSHGPIYAAVLVQLQHMATDNWVLLVGSQKLLKRRLDGISAIVDALKVSIPKEYSTRIRRVDVLQPSDPLYIYLSNAFTVELGAEASIRNCNVYGLEIEQALVFVMNTKNVPTQTNRRATKQRKRLSPVKQVRR